MLRKDYLILILFLFTSCSLALKESKVPPGNLFQGVWINEDSKTRGITKLDIKQDGPRLFVHAWGKCHPEDCDWGVEKGIIRGKEAIVNWNQGFVVRTMTIFLREENKLYVITDNVYKDRRGRRLWVGFFIKGH